MKKYMRVYHKTDVSRKTLVKRVEELIGKKLIARSYDFYGIAVTRAGNLVIDISVIDPPLVNTLIEEGLIKPYEEPKLEMKDFMVAVPFPELGFYAIMPGDEYERKYMTEC